MDNLPLCVDLDGTLVKTNTLAETALFAFKKNPLFLFHFFRALMQSKAHAKSCIGNYFSLATSQPPYNEEFLVWLREQHSQGRTLILATASDKNIAAQIAQDLGIFDDVIASTVQESVTAGNKSLVLCGKFGTNKFSYAGNSQADLAVWNCSHHAILVDAPRNIREKINKNIVIEQEFTTGTTPALKLVAKTMRIHQWTKNALLFVPALAAHEILIPPVAIHALFGFLSFSLLASAVYIFNDLTDISSDRLHPTKRNRPIASGKITLKQASIIAVTSIIISAIVAISSLPITFFGVLLLYIAINICYSLFAKKIAYLDIIILAGLYVLRIFAGSFATGISTSKWLFLWALVFFLSLAIVKRVTEISRASSTSNKIHGRGYTANDRTILEYAGIASAVLSLIVLAFYIRSSSIFTLYSSPQLLWGIVFIVGLWLTRIWHLALKGSIPDDPVLFAAKDPLSYTALLAGICIMMLAS